ncbi:ATP-binding protein [Cupriavidus sp. AcVe19-1a]|nr:ATP-binding protein [Cupriavidus sp. AcVe19-1a]
MLLVNVGTNKQRPSRRITEIAPRDGAAVVGPNGVGKTTTLRLTPLFYGHLPSQIIQIGHGQKSMPRFTLPTPESAIVFEYQRGPSETHDLRLAVLRARRDNPDALEYRLFESGFRREIFVDENGTFLDDEGSKTAATNIGVAFSMKLDASEYRAIILNLQANTKQAHKLRQIAREYSFAPRAMPNLDRLVGSVVKEHVSFADLIQVAAGMVDEETSASADSERKKLLLKQTKSEITDWIKNRRACEDANKITRIVDDLESTIDRCYREEDDIRLLSAEVSALLDNKTKALADVTARQNTAATQRQRQQESEQNIQATLTTAFEQAQSNRRTAEQAYDDQAALKARFDKEDVAGWAKKSRKAHRHCKPNGLASCSNARCIPPRPPLSRTRSELRARRSRRPATPTSRRSTEKLTVTLAEAASRLALVSVWRAFATVRRWRACSNRLGKEMKALKQAQEQYTASARQEIEGIEGRFGTEIWNAGIAAKKEASDFETRRDGIKKQATSQVAALTARRNERLRAQNLDPEKFEQWDARRKEIDAILRTLENKVVLVEQWRAWLNNNGPTELIRLEEAARDANTALSKADDAIRAHEGAVKRAIEAYRVQQRAFDESITDLTGQVQKLQMLEGELPPPKHADVSIDPSMTAAQLAINVSAAQSKLASTTHRIGELHNTIYNRLTAGDNNVKEFVERFVAEVSNDRIEKARALVRCHRNIPNEIVANLNNTLRVILDTIERFHSAIQSFESDIKRFNKDLGKGLQSVQQFERIRGLEIEMVTDFSDLGFMERLKQVSKFANDSHLALGRAGQRRRFPTKPPKSYSMRLPIPSLAVAGLRSTCRSTSVFAARLWRTTSRRHSTAKASWKTCRQTV